MQRHGDVESLSLLHPRVVGGGPDGAVCTEEDDLTAHRSGALRITRLVEDSVDVQAGTRTVASVEAVQEGTVMSGR